MEKFSPKKVYCDGCGKDLTYEHGGVNNVLGIYCGKKCRAGAEKVARKIEKKLRIYDGRMKENG